MVFVLYFTVFLKIFQERKSTSRRISGDKDTETTITENSFEVLEKSAFIKVDQTPTFREWKKDNSNRSSLPQEARTTLKTWLHEHIDNPYPTEYEKNFLAQQVNKSLVSNGFIKLSLRDSQEIAHRVRGPRTQGKLFNTYPITN